MNKMVAEHESHFEMSDGRSPFKVPKKGLSEKLQNEIRAMCEPQKLAGGGAVDAFPQRAGSAPIVYDQFGQPVPSWLQQPPSVAAPDAGTFGNINVPAPASAPAADPLNQHVDGLKRDAAFVDQRHQARASPPAQTEARDPDPLMTAINGGASKQRDVQKQATELGIRPEGAAPSTQAAEPPPAVVPPPPVPRGAGGSGAPMAGLNDIRAGSAAQQTAAMQSASIAEEVGREQANAYSATNRQLEANMLEDKRRNEESAQRTAALMSDYKRAQEDMRNISATVDPGRFWASRTTGGKIAGIIGLALGALGAGPDGVNRAAMMLNQAIDRDLDAQKAEHTIRLQKGKASVDAAHTAYGLERQRFGDDMAASNAAKASLLGIAENNLKKIAAAAKGPQEQAQAMALLGQIQVQKGQLEAGLANTAFDNETQRRLANGQLTKASGGTPAEGKAIREAVTNYNVMTQTVSDLEGLIGDTNIVTEKVGPKAERMRTLAGSLLLQVKTAENLGALDKGSIYVAEQIIGDPNATFTMDGTKVAKLRALLGQSKLKVESMAGAQR